MSKPLITIRQKGDFSKLTKHLIRLENIAKTVDLKRYAEEGLAALKAATPVDTGLTADSWFYEIKQTNGRISIAFYNSNIQNGIPIAIILQYGHGTRNGGWVQGRDYINPAIQPIFDKIANDAWKEVTKV